MLGAFWIGRLVAPSGSLWLFAAGTWDDEGAWADYATWPTEDDNALGGVLIGAGVI